MRDQVLALMQRHLTGPFKPSGGSNILCRCPFHKGGEERKPSFSVNTEKGLFHCFTCHVAGDLRYLLRMLGLSRSTIDAEVKPLQELIERQKETYRVEKVNAFSQKDPFSTPRPLPEELLGVYEWCPTGLVEKGFDVRLLQDMEVGFDRMQHRITYPLRDLYGALAGISAGATIQGQWPKYKVYQGGRRDMGGRYIPGDYGDWFDKDYPGYTCENHDYLWNAHRVLPRLLMAPREQSILYVVEGFKACLWMIQNGFPNTVALMGSYISDKQQQMLHRLGGTVVLCLDNDSAGRKATLRIGDLLWWPMYGHIKVMQYPEGDDNTQPDSYQTEDIQRMALSAIPFLDHVNNPNRKD